MFILQLLISFWASAGTIEVIGPCSPTPLYSGEFNFTQEQSVGKTSVDIFARERIAYIGSELGFSSIYDTPTDKAAIEWLGPNELRAYGWCYEVDGFQPEVMPSAYLLSGTERLVWFFAFSHYKEGKFISQCEPAHVLKSEKFCN